MNGFKKEELELIAECVEADFYHTNWSKCMYEPLMNKIQSMIDNYCEHSALKDVGKEYKVCRGCSKEIYE